MTNLIILLFFMMSIFNLSHADPAGEIRFKAKIISSKGDFIEVEASKKIYRIPKESCQGDVVIGKIQEIALTPEQYYEMKNGVKHEVGNQ